MGHDWQLPQSYPPVNPQSVWVCKNCHARVWQPVKPSPDHLVYTLFGATEADRLTCEETQVWNIMNS